MQPITARVAYMTTPGNHECMFNFSGYRSRYQMPPAGAGFPADAMYYDFHAGPVAFVMADTEGAFNTPKLDDTEKRWITEALARGNAASKFLVVAHHRPIYFSPSSEEYNKKTKLSGIIEQTYIDAKVDLVTCGHLHSYERTYPLEHDAKVATNYTFATAPVYVVNGAAGNREGNHGFEQKTHPWSAFRSSDVGLVKWQFAAAADAKSVAMRSQFVQSRTGEIIDEYTLTKAI